MISILSFSPDEGLREGHAIADLPALLGRADRIVWVDLAAPSREETAILSSVFHFHPLAIDDCTAGRQNPKVEDFKDYLFILTHGVHPDVSIGEFKTRPLSMFVGRSYIVSFHREKSRSVQHAMESARHNPKILSDGPDSILYNVLDYQVDQYLPVLENFEKKVDEVEGLIFTSPTEQVLTEVLDFKKALMRLRRISGHQRDTLLRLVRREFPVIDERAIFGLRDVADHLVRIADLSDTYREQIADALAAHLSIVSNRTNEIMRVLTVIATIFIPLTFIVGIYGMNFEHMPELHWRYGYLGVWVVMLLVVAGMTWFFRRRGLFGGRS